MCCVVVSSPSTPVNMGRCCRVASHLLCLCCPTPALPVRHTAACGCVIDCHAASHGCASSDSHVVYRCKLHDTKTLADAQNPHSHSVVVVLQFASNVHVGRRCAPPHACFTLPVVRHTAACGCVIDCHVASHLLSLRRRQAVITLASKDRQTDRRAVIGSFQRLCHRLRCVISDRIVANCQVASHLLCSRNCQVA